MTMTGNNVGVIVQARMTSQRLPGKVLIEICGKPMVEHVYDRLRACSKVSRIVLAIPDTKESDPLEEQAKRMNCLFYRGDEHDVLSRYYHAAKTFHIDTVIRITGDCPLIDPKVLDGLVDDFLGNETYDYMAVDSEGNFPRGLDSEIFSFKTLERAYREATLEYEREHVTPFIYQHENLFKALFVEAQGKFRRPGMRLTVDTEEDLSLMTRIFETLYGDGRIFGIEEVIDLLDEHPDLRSLNAHIRQKSLGE